MSVRKLFRLGVVLLALLTCLALTVTAISPKRLAFHGHTGPVSSVVSSPDGTIIASVAKDESEAYCSIKLWNVATCTERATLKGHACNVCSVAFSPDGKTLASAGAEDMTIKLWEVATGKERLGQAK